MPWMISLCLWLSIGISAALGFDLGEGWHPKIPGVAGVYHTTHASTWPSSTDSAGKFITREYGHTAHMLLSLSGLAAKACFNGLNNSVIEVNMGSYPYAMAIASEDLIDRKGLQDLGTYAPWDLVEIFKQKGIVKGYVVYHYETGGRGLWNYSNGGPYDPSSNVATVFAHQLDAILIEQSMIAEAQSHGLAQLADCRGITQEQCWQTYKNQVNKKAIVACDPKTSWNRDYAIATGCFILFPLDPVSPLNASVFYRDVVLPEMEEPFPVLGWAGGDEYSGTHAATIRGGFNTATSYDTNLLVHGLLEPGTDDAILNYEINRKGRFDPASLEWEDGMHYTSFIMSDGDFYGLNNTYIDDQLGGVGEYFGNPDRGQFPMTWSCAGTDLLQTCPSSVRTLGELATPNDSFILMGGGYYYPDLFPALEKHMQRINPLLRTLGIKTWVGNFSDYDSPAARHAQSVIASHLDDMAGLFAIQYSPYTAGHGDIDWADNSGGYAIPVMAAKHAIWANSSFPGEGSPLQVAQYLAQAPTTGANDSEACFDWTIIHIWSFFNQCQNMNQSGAVFNPSKGIERCLASAKCCWESLPSHVRLVSAEELAWQTALRLRTTDTLNRMLDLAEEEAPHQSLPELDQKLVDDWRAILSAWPSAPSARYEGFMKIRDVLRTVRDATEEESLEESFEGFAAGPLPKGKWINSSGLSEIVKGIAAAGSQSLSLEAGASADKLLYTGDLNDAWVEAKVRFGTLSPEKTSPPKPPATAVIRFAADGILAFDGDGSGGGAWRKVALELPTGAWMTVKVHLNYTAHRWELFVNDVSRASGLGFVDNTVTRLHGMKFAGRQHLDDIKAQTSGMTLIRDWERR